MRYRPRDVIAILGMAGLYILVWSGTIRWEAAVPLLIGIFAAYGLAYHREKYGQ